MARKIILTAVFPWIVLGLFPIYLYFAGWSTAILHILVAILWSVLLTDVVLVRFRKLPFTCTLPVFKQHSIVVLLAGCFGFLLYAVSLPEFESWALADPVRFLGLLPAILAVWYVPRRLTKTTVEHEKKLIFEETAPITLEVLQLSD